VREDEMITSAPSIPLLPAPCREDVLLLADVSAGMGVEGAGSA
jgi:hypothetical protein